MRLLQDTNSASVHQAAHHDRRQLGVVLAVTATYFFTEILGGYFTNSLALFSDALHMLTDIATLVLSLVALWVSTRPASAAKTYGYLRAEILGALSNGLLLWLLVGFIWYEAVRRLGSPQPVAGLGVMAIAAIGLAVNGFSAVTTYRAQGKHGRGLALHSVFVHTASDFTGCAGVLFAGGFEYFLGWTRADAVASLLIGALVVWGSWGLVREGVDILMEAVPAHIDLDELRGNLLAIGGTEEVHDLHVWCLTSREFALSAHAVVEPDADQDQVLSAMSALLEHKFNIRHMTVQLERDNRRHREPVHF